MHASAPPIPEDALLLCVDMQPGFLPPIHESSRVIRRCKFAVAAARGIGLKVAFTEQVPQKLGRTVPELLTMAPDAPCWGKQAFGSLADEGIRDQLLTQRGIRHLILCGIETPVCIYQTTIGALAEGLQVTILSDAVGARRPDDARTVLEALARAGAHVLPSETVFYALLRDAKHPFFRAYTHLVKEYV